MGKKVEKNNQSVSISVKLYNKFHCFRTQKYLLFTLKIFKFNITNGLAPIKIVTHYYECMHRCKYEEYFIDNWIYLKILINKNNICIYKV